jgi:two-component system LytT family sensor kinase
VSRSAPSGARRRAGRWRAAGWVLAAWTLAGVFRAVDRYFSDPFQLRRLEFGLWEAVGENLLGAYLWAAITPLVVWIARRSLPRRNDYLAPLALLTSGAIAVPVAHAVLYQLAYPVLMGFPLVVGTQLGALRQLLPMLYPTELVAYGAIVGATWMLTYSSLSRERDLRSSQLQTRLAGARLAALQMQLHPHFLFNTLNSILPLVFRDGDSASRTVARLTDLLRLSLQHETSDLIPLSRELETLKVYLEIQRTRFQDRLTIRLDVEAGVSDALVPNLILQPLVENAVKHGIAARPGAGSIDIRVRREGDDRLTLVVSDDGAGPAPSGRPAGREGVGLRNTRDRLELLYGSHHAFSFRGAPGLGCQVALSIPLAYSRREAPTPARPLATPPTTAGPPLAVTP